MSTNEKIIIKCSGVCDHLGCSANEVYELYLLYKDGFITDQFKSVLTIQSAINVFMSWGWNTDELRELLSKEVESANRFTLDMEIKKSNGTFEEWQNELESDFNEIKPIWEAMRKVVKGNNPIDN